MKKFSFLLSTAALSAITLLFGCDNMTISMGDGSNKIVGNGIPSSENRTVAPFNQIEIEGVFNVILTQGDKEAVKVETDENVQPLILTSVSENVLTIKMKDSTSISKMKKITLFITIRDLTKLTSTGVGSLKCPETLKLKNFTFESKGVGATELKLSVEKFTVLSEIVGALILSGDAKEVAINHHGLGIIQAFDLKAEKLSLHSDGIGAAEVFASKELNINSSGLGGVKYKGNPSVKHIKNDGICKVEIVN